MRNSYHIKSFFVVGKLFAILLITGGNLRALWMNLYVFANNIFLGRFTAELF